jgi:hypothetical protein
VQSLKAHLTDVRFLNATERLRQIEYKKAVLRALAKAGSRVLFTKDGADSEIVHMLNLRG